MVEDAGMAAGVPDLVRQVQGMKKRYSNFDHRLPKRKELGGFLREISSNLSEESLSNQLIEPGTPQRRSSSTLCPSSCVSRGPTCPWPASSSGWTTWRG